MTVLLTVSGIVPDDLDEEIAEGRRPRADYLEMARAFGADLIDYAGARRETGRVGGVLERIGGPDLTLAWACFRRRRRYDTVMTDGEQVGLPYAALTWWPGRRPRHVMIGHRLSVPKKVRLIRMLRLTKRIDTVVVYSSWQKRYAEAELGIPQERVALSTFMVDTAFFAPDAVSGDRLGRAICAVGLELRDFETLVAAVRGVDVKLVIASGSPWSKRPDLLRRDDLPPNVEVCTLRQFDLRQLYADSRLVVMPLFENDFQAGVTTILEAMAMGKAVVCTRTAGQTDVIEHERTGLYVEPGDAPGLRSTIERLLDDPEFAERLGAAGRAWVERADVKRYAEALSGLIRG